MFHCVLEELGRTISPGRGAPLLLLPWKLLLWTQQRGFAKWQLAISEQKESCVAQPHSPCLSHFISLCWSPGTWQIQSHHIFAFVGKRLVIATLQHNCSWHGLLVTSKGRTKAKKNWVRSVKASLTLPAASSKQGTGYTAVGHLTVDIQFRR